MTCTGSHAVVRTSGSIDMAAAIAAKINPSFTGARLEEAKAKVHKMCAWDEASLVGFGD